MIESEQFPPKQWDVYWNVLTCDTIRRACYDCMNDHLQEQRKALKLYRAGSGRPAKKRTAI